MQTNYTPEQAEAAAKALGFQNAELMLAYFTAKVMAGGLCGVELKTKSGFCGICVAVIFKENDLAMSEVILMHSNGELRFEFLMSCKVLVPSVFNQTRNTSTEK